MAKNLTDIHVNSERQIFGSPNSNVLPSAIISTAHVISWKLLGFAGNIVVWKSQKLQEN
jgi:hypothetical protein